ncbi:MAG TPA: DUF4846 domain-containing protein [Phycisphaerae bacterium]|nr:DUF4846 domain-containing protein [Phycisphaerae bacterium]
MRIIASGATAWALLLSTSCARRSRADANEEAGSSAHRAARQGGKPRTAAPPPALAVADPKDYRWLNRLSQEDLLVNRIRPPQGYVRTAAPEGSFGRWLRHLPLKKGRPDVLLHDGRKKRNQSAHWAVVDIGVGPKDLQQCADAVIRLRAEYLFARGRHDLIHFNFTSGDRADWTRWSNGYRPAVSRNKVAWRRTAAPDGSRQSFRKYLDAVFTYAGSASLSGELVPVRDAGDTQIGDVFIHGGFPGHAAIVVNMAVDPADDMKLFLLAQSYMPAQDIHILVNRADATLSPWYRVQAGEAVNTPEWAFWPGELRRFR